MQYASGPNSILMGKVSHKLWHILPNNYTETSSSLYLIIKDSPATLAGQALLTIMMTEIFGTFFG